MFPPLFFLLPALVASTTAAKLPENWTTCKRNDPNMNACLKKVLEDIVFKDVLNGVPSLGLPPFSPLHFDRLVMGQKDSNSPVAVKLTFKDIDIKGFDMATVNSVNFDWNKGHIAASLSAPSLETEGNYEVEGKVLLLPVRGDGKCNFTMRNVVTDLDADGSFVTKNGKQYFHVDKARLNLKTDRLFMQLDNLFNGDKTLGNNMNKLLNDNWEQFLNAFQDNLERGYGNALMEIANRLFDKVPFDDIAPK